MNVQIPPSGEQIELRLGEQRACVVEVGGGLREYTLSGRAILDGYDVGQICSGARGQVLVPWPNRLCGGSYAFAGVSHQLDISEPERQNAIHGLVRWRNWTVHERSDAKVVMRHVLHPQPGYPFALDLAIEYSLSPRGLSVKSQTTNVGLNACPYGSGAHPYLTVGTPLIDDATLVVPANSRLAVDERMIPTRIEAVADSRYDFRKSREIRRTRLDTCYTDLLREGDEFARVELAAGNCRVTLWMDQAYRYLMVFSGDSLPSSERRRGLAVEPMTGAPNAFQSGGGLLRLEPGESHSATWGIEPADV